MKDAFLRCMALLYPVGDGVPDRDQLTDLARTFSMGWCEGLKSCNDIGAVRKWAEECKSSGMADMRWRADHTWQWW